MPGSRNYGNLNEKEIVNALNKKRYWNLDPNMKTFIRDMFGVVNKFDKIYCRRCEDYIKPDIEVRIGRETRFVSIKSGTATGIHSEVIETVVPYLAKCGVDKASIRTLLLYHYGDGTIDGSGQVRKNYHQTYAWLEKDIQKFNLQVNKTKEMVIDILDRFLFQGVDESSPRADYIYFGTVDYGMAVSYAQIVRHITVKSYGFLENMHIGPVLIRSHAKYANCEIKNEYNHRRVDFYWPHLKDDIEYIYKRYSNPDNL